MLQGAFVCPIMGFAPALLKVEETSNEERYKLAMLQF